MAPGLKLKIWRLAQTPRLSQAQLGARLDPPRSQSAVDRYERGRVPEPETVISLYVETGGAVVPNDFYSLPELPELAVAVAEFAPAQGDLSLDLDEIVELPPAATRLAAA